MAPFNSSDVERPSLDVIRRLTDVHVMGHLMETELLTRSQIAVKTGISKPTVSESIRRLGAEGRVTESGQQAGGRGRSGIYYRLSDELGVALAMHAGPEGVLAEVVDLRGRVIFKAAEDVQVPSTPRRLAAAIERVARAATESVPVRMLAVSMSVADPFDQRTGRIRNLPNSPFLVGELRPYAVLARVGIQRDIVLVDNDTNFGAIAEHRAGAGQGLDDFGFLWLGAGIGLGLIMNGALHRGWTGLAGEIWQTVTHGPNGAAMNLAECFAQLGLRPGTVGTTAIDVDLLNTILQSNAPKDLVIQEAVIDAVTTAIVNVASLINPKAVIIAGPWADYGHLRRRISERIQQSAIPADIRQPRVKGNPFLVGARLDALDRARRSVLYH